MKSVRLLLCVAGAWACRDSAPDEPDRFARYVAFGNSVTAGFQSAGINDSTQRQSYAALVGAQLGVPFHTALLARPGCPPPLRNAFTGTPEGGPGAPVCSFLVPPFPASLHNVAVPGARVVDVFSNTAPGSAPNPLTTLLLGGLTQLQAARQSRPTFVTLWIGHNEVLNSALSGDTVGATPVSTFTASYRQAVDSVATLDPLAVLVIGVLDVTRIPALSPGSAYWAARSQGLLPPTFQVSPDCAAADSVWIPVRYAIEHLYRRAAAGETVTLRCDDPRVLARDERAALSTRVRDYNQAIASLAAARQWEFIDPNPLFDSLWATGEIPAFPHLPPSPLAESQPFGKWLSLDAVHPSSLAHRLIANRIIEAVNRRYGRAFPKLAL